MKPVPAEMRPSDHGQVLTAAFYQRTDVVRIAQDLIGKALVTTFDGERTVGLITETEAYAGIGDRASHAFGGKRTARTDPMYQNGGIAYVYLCYGMHHLFNVVTHRSGTPHAVLIRAVVPIEGLEMIHRRRGTGTLRTDGPALLTKALGIRTEHTGLDLSQGPITIEDHGVRIPRSAIIIGPRIGVDYAGDDALLPYRFRIAPSHPILRSTR